MHMLTGFREMHFDFLAPLMSTLEVNDYELKVRPVTMVGYFSVAMFSYGGRCGISMELYLNRDEVLISGYDMA